MYRDAMALTGKVVLNAGGYGSLGAEATRACLFFSVPASDFITGQILLVDGGVTSRQ